MAGKMSLFKELQSRDLIAQCSDFDKVSQIIDNRTIPVYCGFDPTSDSLTVGNLLALITLKRFSKHGHMPIILVGNFTAMIGDPTGRRTDRPQLTEHEIHINSQKIAVQCSLIVGAPFQIVFNGSFYENVSILEFIRDVACRFSVNNMLENEAIHARLSNGGLTFGEMSYTLFQASDFDMLFEKFRCILQIGGNDQWGNICSGIQLCRKKKNEVFGLTFPLLTKKDGTKFGKSSEGAVWLDSSKTSVWDFFQFWMNIEDDEIENVFKMFSLSSDEQLDTNIELHNKDKSARILQNALAIEMTELVHGKDSAYKCRNISRSMYYEDWDNLTQEEFELACKVLGSANIDSETVPVVSVLIQSGLATSKSDAVRIIESGGITINGAKVNEPIVKINQFFYDKFLIIKKGKKNVKIVRKLS